ncbi:UNKNOWN [Stylonychia lemnae]|uniref:Uncharacterized protein n=1 Tax=Stylonychia lemnae TaxID=5949 RepID=A0A078AFE0_STYLE|nr:UNKNOWN [Stylonychia lemnae]|eukprot:CDW80964.1 UNKNOWN [Stylonychia lemnae]
MRTESSKSLNFQNLIKEEQSTRDNSAAVQIQQNPFNFNTQHEFPRKGRIMSYESQLDSRNENGISPQRKSIASYQRADMNDFTKGISDMKIAYMPHFGFETIQYRDNVSSWNELSKNVLSGGAPKHSAILEIVQGQYKKEEIQQEMQKRAIRVHKVSFNDSEILTGQKNGAQYNRQNSKKKREKFETKDHTQYEIEKEVINKLRWWRLGAKDDDEHGYRQIQSNFNIKMMDLKKMGKNANTLLDEQQNASKYFKSFLKQSKSEKLLLTDKQHSQNEKLDNLQSSQIMDKQQNTSQSKLTFKIHKFVSPNKKSPINDKSKRDSNFLQKIKERGQQQRLYFESFQQSPTTIQNKIQLKLPPATSQNQKTLQQLKGSIFLQNKKHNPLCKRNQIFSQNVSSNEFRDFSNSAISTTILAGTSPLQNFKITTQNTPVRPSNQTLIDNIQNKSNHRMFFSKRLQGSQHQLSHIDLHKSLEKSSMLDNYFSGSYANHSMLYSRSRQNLSHTSQDQVRQYFKTNEFFKVQNIYDKEVNNLVKIKQKHRQEWEKLDKLLNIKNQRSLKTSQSSKTIISNYSTANKKQLAL